MAPVELVGLAGLEHQRDEGRDTIAGILAPIGLPARHVAPHGIVGALKTLALQQIMDPRHPQPLALAAPLILFHPFVNAVLTRPDQRQRSADRRYWHGCVSTFRSPTSADQLKKQSQTRSMT